MGGVDFPLIGFTTLYLFAVWAFGRAFQSWKLPAILGHFLAGVLMGPGLLDIVRNAPCHAPAARAVLQCRAHSMANSRHAHAARTP